jgi:hypothetical protein
MTGIIIFMQHGIPFVFGDTLLSSQIVRNENFIIPAARIGNLDSIYKPSGLCQKIVNLSSKLSYVWCGKLSEIVEVNGKICELIKDIGENWITSGISYKIRTEIVEKISPDTGLCVICREDTNRFVLIKRGCEEIKYRGFDIIITGGSGGGVLFEELSRLDTRIPETIQIIGLSKNDSDKIIKSRIFESLIQAKFIFGEYIELGTGAIVESAVFNENSIDKNDDSLFLVWDDFLPFPFSIFPFLSIKKFYEDGYLYVSYRNYYTKKFNVYCIGNPGNLNPPYPKNPDRFNPLNDPIKYAFTIRNRKNGKSSHRSESGKIILDHFTYSDLLGTIIFSKWYHDDYMNTILHSDKIEYPYW